MPPEIRDNERVLVQSDNFSLGISLRHALEALGERESGSAEWFGRLAAVVDVLTNQDFLKRPRLLLDVLKRHELINDDAYKRLVLKLWSMILVSRFPSLRSLAAHRSGCDESAAARAVPRDRSAG